MIVVAIIGLLAATGGNPVCNIVGHVYHTPN